MSAVAFGPKGTVLVAGDTMGAVRLFRTQDALLIREREAHEQQIHAVAASPVEDIYASADDDGVVKLWRGSDLTLLRSWNAEGGRIDGLVFSKDGTTLYVGCRDGAIRRVGIAAARGSLGPLVRHTAAVYALSLDASGRLLVSSGADGRIVWWNLETGEHRDEVRTDPAEIVVTALSPDGKWVAACGASGTVRLWQSFASGPWASLEVSETRLYALAWHPSKPWVAWSASKGKAGVIEVEWRLSNEDDAVR